MDRRETRERERGRSKENNTFLAGSGGGGRRSGRGKEIRDGGIRRTKTCCTRLESGLFVFWVPCLVRSACVCLCVCRHGINEEEGGRRTCKAETKQEAARRVSGLVLSACVPVCLSAWREMT